MKLYEIEKTSEKDSGKFGIGHGSST